MKTNADNKSSTDNFIARFIAKISNVFCKQDADALNRRRKRKEFKEARKNAYDMPAYVPSDFDKDCKIDIYVVAFNNSKLIEYQIKFLKKFLVPNFTHIVIDNSHNKEESEKIRAICVANNVAYAKVFKPKKIRGTYSASHAMAMNWTYEKFIKTRKHNFAMLDHDIFPVEYINVAEYVENNKLFGALRETAVWFLWGGFAFFNWDFVANKKLDFGRLSNFLGLHIADTGSANWKPLYRDYDKSKIPEVDYELYDVFDKIYTPKASSTLSYERQVERCLEYMLNRQWVHLNGASGWHEIGDKNEYSFKILDEIYRTK